MNSLFTRSIAIALTASLWMSLAQSAQSGPRPRLKVVLPPVPKTVPIARGSGASRGCSNEVASSLAQAWPLAQAGQPAVSYRVTWSQTSQVQPTLWVAYPFQAGMVDKLRLVVSDDRGKPIFVQPIVAPSQPSLLAMQFKTALPEPKLYRWRLVGQFRCDSWGANPQVDVLGGWVDYKPAIADLQTQLQQVQPIDRARLYSSTGYWLDALTIVGQNRGKADPKIWDDFWSSLLRSINQPDRLAMPIEFR